MLPGGQDVMFEEQDGGGFVHEKVLPEGEEVRGIENEAPEHVEWDRLVVNEGRGAIVTARVETAPFPQSLFVPQTVILPETALVVKFRIIELENGGVLTGVTPAGQVQL